jgi:hypothetical protein
VLIASYCLFTAALTLRLESGSADLARVLAQADTIDIDLGRSALLLLAIVLLVLVGNDEVGTFFGVLEELALRDSMDNLSSELDVSNWH